MYMRSHIVKRCATFISFETDISSFDYRNYLKTRMCGSPVRITRVKM